MRIALALSLALAACGSSSATKNDAPPVQIDAGVTSPDASCFTNPTTHDEIINACTDPGVQKIYKNSHPPLLNADGTLPPLPQ